MNNIMTKNDYQQIKACNKVKLVNRFIDLLDELNSIQPYEKRKNYTIYLDYFDENDYTTFFIIIRKNTLNKDKGKDIFNIKFKLEDKEYGEKLFEVINKHFIEKSNIKLHGFDKTKNSVVRPYFYMIKNNGIKLKSFTDLHDEVYKDEQNKTFYQILASEINNKKMQNVLDNTKYSEISDNQLQNFKSQKKLEIINEIIKSICEINNMEKENDNDKKYNINIEYNIDKDNKNEIFYKYNIKIIKKCLFGDKEIANLSFSLYNKFTAIKNIKDILFNFAGLEGFKSCKFSKISKNKLILANDNNINLYVKILSEMDRNTFASTQTNIENIYLNSQHQKIKK